MPEVLNPSIMALLKFCAVLIPSFEPSSCLLNLVSTFTFIVNHSILINGWTEPC